jgi:hypothetical protein
MHDARLEVFKTVKIQVEVFWVVMLCITLCGVTTQKTSTWNIIAVKAPELKMHNFYFICQTIKQIQIKSAFTEYTIKVAG